MSNNITFKNYIQVKENGNVFYSGLSGTDYIRNDELTKFIEKENPIKKK